jgi:hypothetical protein
VIEARYAPRMIRLLVFLAIAGALAFCGSTVKLGERTFFGHVRRIWATDEVQDLKEGVKEKAGPAANKVKKGVEAGYKAMTDDEKKAGSGSAAGSGSGSAAPAPAK